MASVLFVVAMSVHGLAEVPDANMLHQPHQPRRTSAPGTRITRVLNFDTPDFDKVNRVNIPPMEIVPENALVEITISALAGDANEYLEPAQTWISPQGIQLLYNGQSVYYQSEFETLTFDWLHQDGAANTGRKLDMYNDVDSTEAIARGTAAWTYYIPLSPMVYKLLSNVGPMASYAASKWAIEVGLLPLSRIAHADGAGPVTATITSMRLLVNGHLEDSANAQAVSVKLANDGIRVIMSQPNHIRTSLAAAPGQQAISLSEVQGEVTSIVAGVRVTTGLTSTTPSTKNNLDWQIFPLATDTIAIGTQTDPTRVHGRFLPILYFQKGEMGQSYSGSISFPYTIMNKAGTAGALTKVAGGLIPLSLCEAASGSQKFGMFSGSLRINNDFRLTFDLGTTPAASTLDLLVYVRRVMVFRHDGFTVVNEE